MSSFTISPGSYNYYVEAGGMGECFELSPLWSIVVNGNTIVSGEGVFGLTGSFIVEEPEIYGCTETAAFNYDANANTDDGSCGCSSSKWLYGFIYV